MWKYECFLWWWGKYWWRCTKTPYDSENINAYSNNEGYNYEVAPEPHTNDININANYDDDINYYGVTPDTTTHNGNIETLENTEGKKFKVNQKGNG